MFNNPGNLPRALELHVQHWADWVRSYPAEREHLPMKEVAMQHNNEADVVRSAAMYLVHPVMAALDAWPTTRGALALQSEDVSVSNNFNNANNANNANNKSTVRTDITFYRYSAVGPHRPIAVMEFKRRGVIRPDQFNAAFAAGPPAGGGTLFQGPEALKLIKQAAAFAMTFRTKYVVLCDWSYLVLCYFVDMQYTPPISSVGARVQIQILEVGDPRRASGLGFDNSVRSHRFRPALLGFLKSAFDETP